MSKAALSATVQAHILKRVRAQATKILENTKLKIRDKNGKEIFNPETGFSLEKIRKETNPNQEAIVSRGGLKRLAQTFKRLEKDNVLATSAVELLGSDSLFDNFAEYLLVEVNKQEKQKSISSDTEFSYVGLKPGDEDTTARMATLKTGKSLRDVVLVSNISHGKFNEYFIKFLRTQSSAGSDLVDFIQKSVDTGHLTGVFNIRLQRIFGFKVSQRDRSDYRSISIKFSDANDELNNLFQKIITLISDADYLSSNIVFDLELFSTTTKLVYDKNGNPTVSVETQLSAANQEIGRKLAVTSRYLNNLLDAARTQAVNADKLTAAKSMEQFIVSLKPLADEVLTLATALQSEINLPDNVRKTVENILKDNETIQTLVTAQGSDSILTSIEKTIVNTIKGKPLPTKSKTVSIDRTVGKVKSGKQPGKQNVNVPKIKKTKLSSRPVTGIKMQRPAPANLVNLLNASLHDQIRKNMGTGNRRDVLNYRTGRFANSVKVERVSESRMGMITAFYTYMKNPYATFSRGGRQEFPRTRDPKTLISKSIREIASTLVTNQLRAVNV